MVDSFFANSACCKPPSEPQQDAEAGTQRHQNHLSVT